MPKQWRERGHENLDKGKFPSAGPFDIPIIRPAETDCVEFIRFGEAKKCSFRSGVGVHFFTNDATFSYVWSHPDDYTAMLSSFACVLSPDFSTYTDYPVALQIWNHYRKHWLAAYWQSLGMTVIPSISWSTPQSYDWCFNGEPKHSTVAVASTGALTNKQTRLLFLAGYEAMMERLEPEKILFYGEVPKECKGNIQRFTDGNLARTRGRPRRLDF